MMRAIYPLLLLPFLLGYLPASAQDVPSAESQPPTSATIEATADPASDADIQDRILDIFGEIDALADIQVSVNAGVVTLSGSVPTAEDAARAIALAQRLEGAVTVETRLERDLTVNENLAPALTRFRDDINGMVRALPLVLIALAIALLIAVGGHFLAHVDRLWHWAAPNDFLAGLFATSVRIAFIALALFVFLDILNATAALGAMLGGAGVIGLAIGFALRDTVDNYISSIMLSLRQPFRPFDHVVIGSQEGKVIRLTSRATILMTLNGNHLRIPNATVFKADILNYSRNPERRFEFDLGIDADDDAIAGTTTATAALRELDFVLDDPPPSTHIKEVGDSNIVLTVLGWVNQTKTDFAKARSAAIWAAKKRLEDEGFALPEPIYRLRVDDRHALKQTIEATLGTAQSPPDNQQSTSPETAELDPDVSRETYIERRVAEERKTETDGDLLSPEQPVE